MRKNRFWDTTTPVAILGASLLFATGVTFFLNRTVFYIQLSVTAVIFAAVGWYLIRARRDIRRMLSGVAQSLNMTVRASLEKTPLPVAVGSKQGEIIWYNQKFYSEVLKSNDAYGRPISEILGKTPIDKITQNGIVDIDRNEKRYTVYVSEAVDISDGVYLLYFVENTHLKKISEEYTLSRPCVVLFYIDNMDDLLQNARASERAQISSRVEALIEDWISPTTGVLRRFTSDRFILIIEHRHLQQMIVNKFTILDKIRTIQTDANQNVTLSVGIGQGATLRESEQFARQAIDMALGRGGDQAAVKTKNGYDFYGGVSQGIERHTKVRARVIASALVELIESSDNVLVMGHRYSDLDCLGSAAAFASTVRAMGKQANAVVRKSQTLATELIERYEMSGRGDIFIEPEQAMSLLTSKTLVVITDTNNPRLLESEEIYLVAKVLVVIDHHRKVVDHIDNAVIFYNEPVASSASEMVAELTQYFGGVSLSRLDAESLLAGIMLDTKNFVFNSGVRTFEAAAYLKRFGADTVEVKRLFAGGIEIYQNKYQIVASAQMYGQAAIAFDNSDSIDRQRIAASQAADELLYIKGVEASFVIYKEGASMHISARSLGGYNVQLIMEALGGGGHLTMAGAQLSGITPEKAFEMLKKAIDDYITQRGNTQAVKPVK